MIQLVSSTIVESTAPTMPAHRPGDLIIAFAFTDGSTTNPTIGTGTPTAWTSITNTTDGTLCSISMAWKIAASSSEVTGTWTSATGMIIVVYRNVLDSGTPIGTFQPSAGTSNTITYAAAANAKTLGSSFYVAFVAHRSVNTTLSTAPANMKLVNSLIHGASSDWAVFDTGGPAQQSWPSTTTTITGTALGWQSVVLEIFAKSGGSSIGINNIEFPAVYENANTLSVTERGF